MERRLTVRPATEDQVAELADVASRTFPLACPPSAQPEDIAEFIAENLSVVRFADYLADARRAVLVAVERGRITGYAMTVDGVPDDPDVSSAVTSTPAVELSKLYVLPEHHGGEVSAALMAAALQHARTNEAAAVWLGVNQRNERAQRFYAKHGFTVAGTKRFRLGSHWEQDYVMVRPA